MCVDDHRFHVGYHGFDDHYLESRDNPHKKGLRNHKKIVHYEEKKEDIIIIISCITLFEI